MTQDKPRAEYIEKQLGFYRINNQPRAPSFPLRLFYADGLILLT